MGLRDNISIEKSSSQTEGDFLLKAVNNNDLNRREIELILSLIKQSNFRGDQLENLYNTVIKLQNQYLIRQ